MEMKNDRTKSLETQGFRTCRFYFIKIYMEFGYYLRFSFSFSVFKVLFSVAKGWTETKKYDKISIRACLKNDALKSGVDGEYLL